MMSSGITAGKAYKMHKLNREQEIRDGLLRFAIVDILTQKIIISLLECLRQIYGKMPANIVTSFSTFSIHFPNLPSPRTPRIGPQCNISILEAISNYSNYFIF